MAIGLLARLRRFHYDAPVVEHQHMMLVHGLHMLIFAIKAVHRILTSYIVAVAIMTPLATV
jgi:hypothetical protein